ncbi:vacuolar protein sorting-associated protein 26B [Musca vetustissima]|uniref:vacuolar protein sorting-associated protein 26B n=1 Tax=Musca vetustissima TaxID=27455 RepID=UPI002AB753AB|nr:vacuolar protein sorting-associated protein 26B [Musca vetustissima]
MNFLGFGQSAEIDIVFDGAENKKTAEVKAEDGKMEKLLLYYDGETVSGKVNVTLKKPGSKLEHQGIKIEFIGQIELYYDRGNHHEFKCINKALARPGDLLQNTSYPFEFPNVEKQFEIYNGSNVRLRYFLRATIIRRISDITKEVDIAVHTLCSYPDVNNPIKMEVGIEDCLHIEFEYNKSKYHLKDTIIGKIYFLLVRIKIKHMEIAIIKRESTGSGPNTFTENETIAKFEIMDGAPVKGESIPIRVFLAGYNLTPTMRDINKKFSVKYFLNLVLMDTEDRRYFKQQEITLWRKADIPRYHHAHSQHQQAAVAAGHNTHPQHAPPHLVSGPPAPIAAAQPTLISSSSEVGGNVAATAAQLPIGTGTPTTMVPEGGKMGLFTRESPNQEFLQEESLPTSPVTPSAGSGIPIERGMGDGAAAVSTSPVMLSTTPPPLPAATATASTTGSNNLAASIENLKESADDFLDNIPIGGGDGDRVVNDSLDGDDDKPQVVPASNDFLDSDDAVTTGSGGA